MAVGNKYVILAVDDKPSNLAIVEEALSEGFVVLPATSGKKALEILKKHIPDLVLLDVMMPEMSGFSVAKEIQKDKRLINVPIIFLTALENDKDEEAGLNLGAVDYIRKPISPDLLMTRVYRHITMSIERDLTLSVQQNKSHNQISDDGISKEQLQDLCNELKQKLEDYMARCHKMSSLIKALSGGQGDTFFNMRTRLYELDKVVETLKKENENLRTLCTEAGIPDYTLAERGIKS